MNENLGGRGRFREPRLNIERRAEHRNALAVLRAGPLFARAVPVQLDPVPIRVTEVDRLADAVIGRATDRDARLDEALQSVAERRPVRIPDRDVVQTRRSRGRRRALTTLPGVQA